MNGNLQILFSQSVCLFVRLFVGFSCRKEDNHETLYRYGNLLLDLI